MKYEIRLERNHQCSDQKCSIIKNKDDSGSVREKNPNYSKGEYSKNNDVERYSINIASYDPDNWKKSTQGGWDSDKIVIKESSFFITYTYPLSYDFSFEYVSKNGFTLKQVIDVIVSTYRKIYQEEEETAETVEINYQGKCIYCQEEYLSEAKTQVLQTEKDHLSCSICMSIYQPNETITTLKCSDQHHFHTSCIETWIKKSKTCPLCRTEPQTRFEKPCGKCQQGIVKFEFTGKVLPLELRLASGGLINRPSTNGKYGIWGHDIEDLSIESLIYDTENKILDVSIGS